jgi:hypothetical protein
LDTDATQPLAGVTLQLLDGSDATPGAPVAEPWATCLADASGDCTFTVPDTGPGGANRDRRFWITQTGAPAGHTALEKVVTSADGSTFQETDYGARTGVRLRGGEQYLSSASFMVDAPGVDRSGGVWPSVAANPPFPADCGLNVALVLDLSWSVQESGSQETLKDAAAALVESLEGTPSSVALFTFGSHAPAPDDPAGSGDNVNRPLTAVSTKDGAATVKGWIDGLKVPDPPHQATNWDRGLMQVAQSADQFDTVIVVTDGNPTRYGVAALGTGIMTRFVELESSIFSANTVKQEKNARVVAVGVGDGVGVRGDNLAAISGPVSGVSDPRLNDYYQAGWSQAAQVLRSVALVGCASTVNLVKQVTPQGASGGDVTGSKAAGGFRFTVSGSAGVTLSDSGLTTDVGTGAASATVGFTTGVTSGTLTFKEAADPRYKPYPAGAGPAARNASCLNLTASPPAAVDVRDLDGGGFEVDITPADVLSCSVYNQPVTAAAASVQVAKKWVIQQADAAGNVTGAPAEFTDPGQPGGFTAGLEAHLNLAGGGGTVVYGPLTWGAAYHGMLAGETGKLVENPAAAPPRGCSLVSAEVTGGPDGQGGLAPVTPPQTLAAYDMALGAGLNLYEVTNTVKCHSQLSLYKVLDRSEAAPPSQDWLLQATSAAPGALPGPSGRFDDSKVTEPVTGDVTPMVPYIMGESGGHPQFIQYQIEPSQHEEMQPGSSGSWLCGLENGEGDINTNPGGFSMEGMMGAVSVPYGGHAYCFAVNERSLLTVDKVVEGGAASPTDWTYTATPIGDVAAGLGPLAGLAAQEAGTIRPRQEYRVSEDTGGPPGYSVESVRCVWDDPSGVERTDTFVDAPEITVAEGGHAACTFTNEYVGSPTTPPATTPPGTKQPKTPVPGTGAPGSPGGPGHWSGARGRLPFTGSGGAALMVAAGLASVAAGAAARAAARRRSGGRSSA